MRRHARFLVAFALGISVAAVMLLWPFSTAFRVLAGTNVFFLGYLVLMLRLAGQATPDLLQRHAEQDDEGMPLIVLLATATVAVSLAAIVLVLNGPDGGLLVRILALGAVPLGWAMVQVLLGYHYAHLYYRPDAGALRGGLIFPGSDAPGVFDFLYFSFGIGMTAQVSDVVVSNAGLRKVVLLHAMASFFYNTVLLALAVNAAVTVAL